MIRYMDYQPHGTAVELFRSRADEVVMSGPAGTGKSRAILEKVHLCCQKYPGCRWLMVRKTRASFQSTGLVTFEKIVLPPGHAHVNYQGAVYPNRSEIVFGGMDKSSKIMSGEYDGCYVQEATELTEGDWEDITTRLRWGVMPYQQLLADCNPSGPTHWLKQRANARKTLMIESRHEDNPSLWNADLGDWTDKGRSYIAKLDALSGARYLRLRKGIWAAAEGMVFDNWDPQLHLITSIPAAVNMSAEKLDKSGVPKSWPRVWSIDFGYTNPFVWQAWAVDPDSRIYRYHELYKTQGLVVDHAKHIMEICQGEPAPLAIVCDHDAEDRATFERATGARTWPAYKSVIPGIQAVQDRLRVAGDGRPRLFLMRDALAGRDVALEDSKKPLCTEEEIESYVWNSKIKREEPIKLDDHGCDCMRYLVALVDDIGLDPSKVPELIAYAPHVQISPV